MNTYSVLMPIAGYAIVEVEAENESEATNTACNKVTLGDIEEWDVYEKLVNGNILYPPFNSIDVELIEDPE